MVLSGVRVVKVLVVEDSDVTRRIIVDILESDKNIGVVGEAADGEQAVELTEKLHPDLITMDVRMPRMDGLEATREIMASRPTPIVVLSALVSDEEMNLNFEALQAGALEVLEKPKGLRSADFDKIKKELVHAVISMSEVKVVRRWMEERPLKKRTPIKPKPAKKRTAKIIVFGSSTGGPAALAEILGELPKDFPVPIIIVQHIATGFTTGMVEWLSRNTQLNVTMAEPGETPQPGFVYTAPEDKHLIIDGNKELKYEEGEESDEHIPSIDKLFSSVADSYGSESMGIILTGMGRDGALGMQAINAAGGLTAAQDEASSVVFGMPNEAISLGAAQNVLNLRDIAPILKSYANVENDGQE
ncbi:MAG: chemotaxis-specific protein-glutamate methyltransferase CheB [bacterium]|nr:chemotaxis-specific protein-glutamate methyltransferase CheB [bacterium]